MTDLSRKLPELMLNECLGELLTCAKYDAEMKSPEGLSNLIGAFHALYNDSEYEEEPLIWFERFFTLLTWISWFDLEAKQFDEWDDNMYLYIIYSLWICHSIVIDQHAQRYLNINQSGDSLEDLEFSRYFTTEIDSFLDKVKNKMVEIIEIHIDLSREDIGKMVSHSRFYHTIKEYFEFGNTDSLIQFKSSIQSIYDPNSLRLGLLGRLFSRDVSWNSQHKLLILNFLIQQAFTQDPTLEIIRNKKQRDKLEDLFKIGEELLDGISDTESWNSFNILDDIMKLQKYQMSAGPLTKRTSLEIINLCKTNEIWKYHSDSTNYYIRGLSNHSIKIQKLIHHSNLDIEMQNLSMQLVVAQLGGSAENISHNYQLSELQTAGIEIKNQLDNVIKKIDESGLGIVERRKGYIERKRLHHLLYDLLGIPTNISSGNRGRRVEILFPHQNKNRQNLTKLHSEIEYLPKSLELVYQKLFAFESVLIYPYMIIMVFDHIIQFTRCCITVGDHDFDDAMVGIDQALLSLHETFDSIGMSKYRDCVGTILDFLHDEYENNNHELVYNKSFFVRFQLKVQEVYKEYLKDGLKFPPISKSIEV